MSRNPYGSELLRDLLQVREVFTTPDSVKRGLGPVVVGTRVRTIHDPGRSPSSSASFDSVSCLPPSLDGGNVGVGGPTRVGTSKVSTHSRRTPHAGRDLYSSNIEGPEFTPPFKLLNPVE